MTAPGGLLAVIAGPSGVGKGTVHARARASLPESVLSVSVTTRAPRPGEVDGVDYHFVSPERFQQLIDEDELLEWAEYAGERYGTPRGPVEEAVAAGRIVVLDIELQGALQVKEHDPAALLVFLVPPSFEELERRLRARGTEPEAALQRRLARAREELEAAHQFDVEVVNDDLDRCVEEVLGAIERARAEAQAANDRVGDQRRTRA
ncbi:MAG: guanylate kinase [Nitriliruptor sp.]|nr:MAG: guanylate kinase [Nitriliruptor sp.]